MLCWYFNKKISVFALCESSAHSSENLFFFCVWHSPENTNFKTFSEFISFRVRFVPDQFSFTFNNLYNYIALDYYFKLRFLMHFGIFEIVGNFRVWWFLFQIFSFKKHINNAQGGAKASVATVNTKDSSIASAQHDVVQNGARVHPQLHGTDF